MLSLIENRQYICTNNWLLSFQQKAIVLILVAMAMDFEDKLNCTDEFCKPVKFQGNPLRAYPGITLSFSHRFR